MKNAPRWPLRIVSVLLVPAYLATLLPPVRLSAETARPEEGRPNARPLLAPSGIKPNRTLPKFDPPTTELRFSTLPTDREIMEAGLFEEALIPSSPFEPNCAEENAALVRALLEYRRLGGGGAVDPLLAFLKDYSKSRWRPALLVNLGLKWFWSGYFSKALDAWEESWSLLKNSQEPTLHALADRAAGEFAELNARFGRYDRLEKLIHETRGREFFGSAEEKMARAREGLWMMRNQPGDSFLCGPLALYQLRRALGITNSLHAEIRASKSSSNGFSLLQVRDLAQRAGMKASMVRRVPGSPLTVPCVVHWKVGHFGALVQRDGDRFLLQDSTFKSPMWVQSDAIEEESSGYFLLASQSLPVGWQLVAEAEAARVWGKGNAGIGGGPEPPCDDGCCSAGGAGASGGAPPGPLNPPPAPGMAGYYLQRMKVAYGIYDVPLHYRPPRGPEIYFKVTYNNRDDAQPAVFPYSNLGARWSFNWLSYLATNTADTAVYLPGIGVEKHVSSYPSGISLDGSYTPNRLTKAHLVKIGATHYERRAPDGSKYVFDLPGPGGIIFMTAMIDSVGNMVRFHFDNSYRLRAVTDAIGQVTTIDYTHASDSNKITRVTDPFGRRASLEYNNSGLLTRVTDVAGLVSEFVGTNSIIAFRTPYGTTSFSTSEVQDSVGRSNVVVFRQVTITDPQGNQERLEFRGTTAHDIDIDTERVPSGMRGDPSQILRNTYFFDKRATARGATDGNSAHVFHWMHAEDNRIVTPILGWEKRPNEKRIWYNYATPIRENEGDDPEQIALVKPSFVGRTYTRVVEGDTTQLWRYRYNVLGNVTSATDPAGRETRFIYASNNIDLLEVRGGASALEVNARFTYDQRHLRLSATDASGQTTYFGYNANGQIAAVTNALGEVVRYEYDAEGYLRRILGPVPGAKAEFTYDDYGRMRTIADSDGDTRTYEYDALNRITRMDYPDGTFEATVYDRLDAVKVRDRLGQWTQTEYNSLRQPTQVVDALGRTNKFGWCGCGSLDSLTDALGRTTAWERDLDNRVTAKVYPDGSRVRYEYDTERGLLLRSADAMGQITQYRYALDNHLTNITYLNAVVPTPAVSFSYDSSYDRLVRMVDGVGTNVFTYRPVSNPPVLGAGRLWQVDGPWVNDTVAYTYDPLGRVVNRSIAGVDQRMAYDSLGRTTETTNVLGRFTYEYDGTTRRPKAVHYPNGVNILYDYFEAEDDHRLKTIHNLGPGGNTISRFDYDYDALGRITTWSQQAGEKQPQVWEIGYDRASQLLNVAVHGGSVAGPIVKEYAYSYDAAGNRLSEQIDSAVTSSSYNQLNQLMSVAAGGPMRVRGRVNEPSRVTVNGQPATMRPDHSFETSITANPGANSLLVVAEDGNANRQTNRYEVVVTNSNPTVFAYDLNGNTVMASNATSVTSYEWDAERRLTAVNQGSIRSEFIYDGEGRRVRIVEKDNGIITEDKRFVWCDMKICEERNAANAAVRLYFPQGKLAAGTTLFYSVDHLGSIRELSDPTGGIRAQFSFAPYGKRTKHSGELDAEFGFTGYFFHENSALLLAPYRAYSSGYGRWANRDMIEEEGGLNLYAYVENAPSLRTDPFGLDWMDDFIDWLDSHGPDNLMLGVFDSFTFNLASSGMDYVGLDGNLDQCSSDYRNGQILGFVSGSLLGGRTIYTNYSKIRRLTKFVKGKWYMKGRRGALSPREVLKWKGLLSFGAVSFNAKNYGALKSISGSESACKCNSRE